MCRLGGYIRNATGSAAGGWFDGASAGAAGVADLAVGTAFMVTITFDPATTPKCRMYRQLGGAVGVSGTAPVIEVASITDNGLASLAGNTQGIRVAIYNAATQAGALDGAGATAHPVERRAEPGPARRPGESEDDHDYAAGRNAALWPSTTR